MIGVAPSHRLNHRLVRADAGTGKTYSLTVRYLGLLSRGVEPSRVVASTFTRKAAGEILERLLRRLAEAVLDADAATRLADDLAAEGAAAGAGDREAVDREAGDREAGDREASGRDAGAFDPRRLLEVLARQLPAVSISTLDAFFHRIVRSFRFELGLARMATVAAVSDRVVEPLRWRALEAMLDELSGEDISGLAELVSRVYRGDALRSVAAGLDSVLVLLYQRFLETPEPEPWRRLAIPEGGLDDLDLERAIDAIAMFGARCERRSLVRAIERDIEQARARDWRGLIADGLGKPLSESPPRLIYSRTEIPVLLVELYRPLLDHARVELLRQLAEQTRASHRLLESFDRHFERERRRAGVVLYSDLVLELSRRLPERSEDLATEIAYRLDARVEHLLLDELQDTSLEQWRALSPLVEEILAYGDGSRSLYAVGDPKQSIYGWRGGCAELFDELGDRFRERGHEVMALGASYRSAPEVLAAVNAVFGNLAESAAFADTPLAGPAARFAARFEPHRAIDPQRPGYVRLETSEQWEGDFGDDDPVLPGALEEAIEAEAVEPPPESTRPLAHLGYAADRIAEIVDRRPTASVGVLVQTNRTAAEVLDRLRDRGIEASGEGGAGITDDPAVTAILSALRLADHPGDTVSAHHVAHSPLGPVLGLRRGSSTPAVASAVSRRLRREIMDLGLADALARWAVRLLPSCDLRNARRIGQLLELADLHSSTIDRPGDLVPIAETASVEEPLPARVRVMTVHKAKGLEFDIVVLCELERRIGDLRNPLVEVRRDTPTGDVTGVFRFTNEAVRSQSPELVVAHEQEVERRVADDLAAIYVALTRARSELHVFVQPLRTLASGKPGSDQRTAASVLRWGLCPEASPEDRARGGHRLFEIGSTPSDGERAPEMRGGEAPSRELPQPVPSVAVDRSRRRSTFFRGLDSVAPSRLGAGGSVTCAELLRLEGDADRTRGRLWHAWLRELAFIEDGLPSTDELVRLARAAVPGAHDERIETLRRELETSLEQPQIRALFARPATGRGESVELWRERRYAVRLGDRLGSGVFDRVLVLRRGGICEGAELVELKTDRLVSDEVSTRVEAYRGQVEGYREALAELLGILPTAVRGRLALLSVGVVVDL